MLHLINSPQHRGSFVCNTVLVPPLEATIRYKGIQIAQGLSCETDPLSLFADFPLVAPIAVGVNLICIRSKLVKKHSSMREAISKIFYLWGGRLKPLLATLEFCTLNVDLHLFNTICECIYLYLC